MLRGLVLSRDETNGTVTSLGALSVLFGSVPQPTGSSGGNEGRFSRDLLPVFSAGGHCQQFWNEKSETELTVSVLKKDSKHTRD